MRRRFRFLRKKRVWIPLAIVAILVLLIAQPAWLIARAMWNDRDERTPPPAGMTDDASRLNLTSIHEAWPVPPDDTLATVGLREHLHDARRLHLPLSIAGARHSMGGQTLAPDAIQIEMLSHNAMTYDPATELLHVQAGATWAQVLAFLDPLHRSVAIMQSNDDFSVGGSLSVNCHGWQYDRPPIASSVDSFHLLLADGSIQHCSRTENPELFSLALGGYGLFGVILDADLHTVPNECVEVTQFLQPTTDFLPALHTHLTPPADITMALGRLSIDRDNFLSQSLLYVIRHSSSTHLLPLKHPPASKSSRAVFLASADSDAGKRLRWRAEVHVLPMLSGQLFSRNQLLDSTSDTFADHADATTFILQEYFIPPDHLPDFLAALRTIVPSHAANLLNVTIRDVREDKDTFLRFADRDVLALVLLYQVSRIGPVDPHFIALTQESIDAALKCQGRYYLPYRLDATPEQFARAYPMADRFFALKHKYDPNELFQNQFYRNYAPGRTPTTSEQKPR